MQKESDLEITWQGILSLILIAIMIGLISYNLGLRTGQIEGVKAVIKWAEGEGK